MDGKIKNEKERKRAKRAGRIRKNIEGTDARPRLTVFRSSKHIYAQLIDDIDGKTTCAASTLTKTLQDALKDLKKSEQAETGGAKALAEIAKATGIETVVFDRAGYPYHGRVASLAKGARAGGLQF